MSFRVRLLISFSILIAVTFGIGGTFLISTSFQSVLQEEKQSAIQSFETAQNNLDLLLAFDEIEGVATIRSLFNQMKSQNVESWQSMLLHIGERTIYTSGNLDYLPAGLESDFGQYAYTIKSDELGPRIQFYSKRYLGAKVMELSASYDLSEAYTIRDNQIRIYWMIYSAVTVAGIGMAVILSTVLTKRLKKLTGTVRNISGGDLSKRSNIRTKDEFGQLSRDFDAMADHLQNNILQLEEEMQRKEEFMGAFAHELKTPLTSIIGYADLLRQDGLAPDDRMLAANYIFSEGKRLEQLSYKLLQLLLMEKDDLIMKEVNLHTFVKNIVQALSPMLKEKKIRLTWKCESEKVILEPDLIKSLLYNLVDNAAKAMGSEGGGILIKGRVIPGGTELQIVDNGCGMEEKELSRITEAFYRVDKSRSRAQGGAGLGLSLCKKIVDLHHGNMIFRSIKGKGSCVTVTLYGSKEDTYEKVDD